MPPRIAPTAPSTSLGCWLLFCWTAVLTLLLVLRPLEAPELWWHLARGRAVVAGSVSPSRALLILDRAAEADWLGGVPFYLLWSVGGIITLAAIPVLVALSLVLFARRHVPSKDQWLAAILWLPLVLWVVRDGLQPVPQLFDLCGLAVLWSVLRAEWPDRRRWLITCLAFCVWANLGPGPIWGLLLLVLFPSPGVLNASLVAAALVGGTLTPRGVFTWWDSAVLFAPLASVNPNAFHDSRWNGLLMDQTWSAASIALLLLWGGWVARGWASRLEAIAWARWSVPMLAAMLCRANLPLCGLWILLDLLRCPKFVFTWRVIPQRFALVAMALVVLSLTLIDAAGRGLSPSTRLGWGISHAIDPRLLDANLLVALPERLTGWAPDARSVGIVTWLGGNVTMVDHPQRALLGGRWPLHADLVEDFQGGHRARYRRDDGEWGGWVQRLADWNVKLLFVPAEHSRLHRALIETPWRPADLDSPTAPYVSGDDLQFAATIVELLRQQGFVESGRWQPSAEIYDGQGWRYDVLESIGFCPDPDPAIRQSQFFRSLDIPLASLRALLPVRQRARQRPLRDEFRACQAQLAYQEWVTFGDASHFRKLVVNALSDSNSAGQRPWTAPDPQHGSADAEPWKSCLALYLDGQLAEAVQALPLRTAEEHSAAAMIWLELGETDRALTEFESLLSMNREGALTIAANYWKQQISLFRRP